MMKIFAVLVTLCLCSYAMIAQGADPLRTSHNAIQHVIESSALSISDKARLVTLYERKKQGLSWVLTIRDGDFVHRISVTDDRKLQALAQPKVARVS